MYVIVADNITLHIFEWISIVYHYFFTRFQINLLFAFLYVSTAVSCKEQIGFVILAAAYSLLRGTHKVCHLISSVVIVQCTLDTVYVHYIYIFQYNIEIVCLNTTVILRCHSNCHAHLKSRCLHIFIQMMQYRVAFESLKVPTGEWWSAIIKMPGYRFLHAIACLLNKLINMQSLSNDFIKILYNITRHKCYICGSPYLNRRQL